MKINRKKRTLEFQTIWGAEIQIPEEKMERSLVTRGFWRRQLRIINEEEDDDYVYRYTALKYSCNCSRKNMYIRDKLLLLYKSLTIISCPFKNKGKL
jgi:hypothetical protein